MQINLAKSSELLSPKIQRELQDLVHS
jgi:hypothetical protein